MNNWNRNKFRIFMILLARSEKGIKNPLSVGDLSLISGVSARSLYTLLPIWTKLKYIGRKTVKKEYGSTIIFQYRYSKIYAKAKRWPKWFKRNFPELYQQYYDDLVSYQKSLRPERIKQTTIRGAGYMEDES